MSAAPPEADLEWRAASLCSQSDPEAFFPEKGQSPVPAKALCRRCPVRNLCLLDAFAFRVETGYPALGVWGGTNAAHRAHMTAAQLRDVADAAAAERRALAAEPSMYQLLAAA